MSSVTRKNKARRRILRELKKRVVLKGVTIITDRKRKLLQKCIALVNIGNEE